MDVFGDLFHNITFGILKLVDGIVQAFYLIAGLTPINTSAPNTEVTTGVGEDLISKLMFETEFGGGVSITQIYIYFLAFSFLILGACLMIGIIKSFVNKKDEVGSRKLLYSKTMTSALMMVLMPLFFLIAVWITSIFVSSISAIMGSSSGGVSLVDSIIGSCTKIDMPLDDLGLPKVTIDISFSKLKEHLHSKENFNYWLALLSGGCTLVGLCMVTFTVVERMLHLGGLYLKAPFILAKTPIDEGKSFDQWKEQVVAKFLSLAGIIILMYLFFMYNGAINRLFTVIIPQNIDDSARQAWEVKRNVYNTVKIMFLIGGVFCFTKGGTFTANLISSGAGQFEGMSQQQSMGMLNGGMRIAGRAAGTAMKGATMTGGNLMGGLGGAALAMGGPQNGMQAAALAGAGGAVTNTGGNAITGQAFKPTEMSTSGLVGSGGVSGARAEAGSLGGGYARGGGMSSRQALMYGGLGGIVGYAGAKVVGKVLRMTGISSVGRKIASKFRDAKSSIASKNMHPLKHSRFNAMLTGKSMARKESDKSIERRGKAQTNRENRESRFMERVQKAKDNRETKHPEKYTQVNAKNATPKK